MRWYEIVILLLLLPIGAYLRSAAYQSIRKPDKVYNDIADLIDSIKERIRNHKAKRYEQNNSNSKPQGRSR